MIGVIARREFLARFRSPVAWVILAAVQFMVALLFLLHLDSYLQLQDEFRRAGSGPGVTAFLVPRLFGAAAMIQLMALPLLTMNLVAGEWRDGTAGLLLSAPVSTAEIVLGKYLALLGIVAPMVALTAAMPLSLAVATDVDGGALALAALGLFGFLAAAGAAGLYLSALTRQPIIAAALTLALLLGLLLLGEWARTLGGWPAALLSYPTPAAHLETFLSGLFDTGAAAFFALFAALFLALATRRFDDERLQR